VRRRHLVGRSASVIRFLFFSPLQASRFRVQIPLCKHGEKERVDYFIQVTAMSQAQTDTDTHTDKQTQTHTQTDRHTDTHARGAAAASRISRRDRQRLNCQRGKSINQSANQSINRLVRRARIATEGWGWKTRSIRNLLVRG